MKSLGPEHPQMADVYNNIGKTYFMKKDVQNSVRFHRKSLMISAKARRMDKTGLIRSLSNLGDNMCDMANYSEGLKMFRTVNLLKGKNCENRSAISELLDVVDCSIARNAVENSSF